MVQRRRRQFVGFVLLIGIIAGGSLTPISTAAAATSPSCGEPVRNGGTYVVTCEYTGGEQSFTVPAGVTSLHVVAVGGSAGAPGAVATADIPVVAGSSLYVLVGGNGLFAPGFNGGGRGGSGGGGGGGASDVRTCTTEPALPQTCDADALGTAADPRLIVAGGGGGRSGSDQAGGQGGTPIGEAGAGFFGVGGGGGGGGTLSSGGSGGAGAPAPDTGGPPGGNGASGVAGRGGDGGGGTYPGGGGGGGFFGGGGGGGGNGKHIGGGAHGGGGGGGSSFASSNATGVAFATDTTGKPRVTFTYAASPHITLTTAASPSSGDAPLAVTYTYTLVNDGTDTLFHVGVTDDGCSPVTLLSGDLDADQLLDAGETWTFTCSRTFMDPGAHTSTASAAGTNTQTGLPVSSKGAQTTVTVSGPTSTTTSSTSTTLGTTTTTTTTTPASTAPTNLTITARTASTAGLTWNPVAGASEYRAYVSRTSGSGYFLWASGFTGTSATLYSLTGDFYVVMRAVVGGTESANSNEVLAAGDGSVSPPTTVASTSTTSTTLGTTTTTTTTTPASTAPTNLTITDRTASTVGLTWNPVAGAAEYRAYVSRTSGSGYFLWASGFTGTSATLYSLTGDFYVVMRAVVGGTESANSNEVLARAP